MRFIAIDSETTGLDPNTCQMVELAMIHADVQFGALGAVTARVDTKHWYLSPRNGQQYQGEQYAMNMNKSIMEGVLSGNVRGHTEEGVVAEIQAWMSQLGYYREGFVPCGKNVMGFDMRFLRRLPGWGYPKIKHKHRAIDVGTLMLLPTDECPPDLAECKKRAGIPEGVSHRAVDDAMDCVNIVKWWMAQHNRTSLPAKVDPDLNYNPVAEQDIP